MLQFLEQVSLRELTCRQRPELCGTVKGTQNHTKKFISDLHRHIPNNFEQWKLYGTAENDGTGYGPGVGPGFAPGNLLVKILTMVVAGRCFNQLSQANVSCISNFRFGNNWHRHRFWCFTWLWWNQL